MKTAEKKFHRCKLCGARADALGIYDRCRYDGPLHEWVEEVEVEKLLGMPLGEISGIFLGSWHDVTRGTVGFSYEKEALVSWTLRRELDMYKYTAKVSAVTAVRVKQKKE